MSFEDFDIELRLLSTSVTELTLAGRDLMLLEAVLEALRAYTVSRLFCECEGYSSRTYRSMTYFSGIRIVNVVPTPRVLFKDIFPPIKLAN